MQGMDENKRKKHHPVKHAGRNVRRQPLKKKNKTIEFMWKWSRHLPVRVCVCVCVEGGGVCMRCVSQQTLHALPTTGMGNFLCDAPPSPSTIHGYNKMAAQLGPLDSEQIKLLANRQVCGVCRWWNWPLANGRMGAARVQDQNVLISNLAWKWAANFVFVFLRPVQFDLVVGSSALEIELFGKLNMRKVLAAHTDAENREKDNSNPMSAGGNERQTITPCELHLKSQQDRHSASSRIQWLLTTRWHNRCPTQI